MSDPNERVVRSATKGSFGQVAVRLHPEKLLAAQGETVRRAERKYNIRIKSQDLALLDALADQAGRPRSQLINELLHDILLRELRALGDSDAQALVATTADEDAAYDPLTLPWVFDVLRSEIGALVENLLWHTYEQQIDFPPGMSPKDRAEIEAGRNSEAFNILKARIEGLQR